MKLILGLGNPGECYATTRHNAGAWFAQILATEHGATLKHEAKLHAHLAKITPEPSSHTFLLAVPNTYMNESGRALAALARFYKLQAADILVAHDELDLPVGSVRLKIGGGHGGHNGLRDILKVMQADALGRLRIGIGHPGHASQVTQYVLDRPSHVESQSILESLELARQQIPNWLKGDSSSVMKTLNSIK